jgi:hypothetical protein
MRGCTEIGPAGFRLSGWQWEEGNMTKSRVTTAVLALTLAAMPALAGQADLAIIHDQCGVQLNQPPPVCDCIASSASVKLNENQQAFMAAQITSNGPEIGRTQALLDQNQALGVAEFMTTVIAACGG